jgi:hypothetical protein
MAATLKDKRTPITTPPYQVPSVDVTPDPPIFSLITTFKYTKINYYNYAKCLFSFCAFVHCKMYNNSDFLCETLPLKILTHANLTHRSVKFMKTFFYFCKAIGKKKRKKAGWREGGKRLLSPRL